MKMKVSPNSCTCTGVIDWSNIARRCDSTFCPKVGVVRNNSDVSWLATKTFSYRDVRSGECEASCTNGATCAKTCIHGECDCKCNGDQCDCSPCQQQQPTVDTNCENILQCSDCMNAKVFKWIKE